MTKEEREEFLCKLHELQSRPMYFERTAAHCSYRGCQSLVVPGSRYCEACLGLWGDGWALGRFCAIRACPRRGSQAHQGFCEDHHRQAIAGRTLAEACAEIGEEVER